MIKKIVGMCIGLFLIYALLILSLDFVEKLFETATVSAALLIFIILCLSAGGIWHLLAWADSSEESEEPKIIRPQSQSDVWETLEIPRTAEKKNSLTDPWKQKALEA